MKKKEKKVVSKKEKTIAAIVLAIGVILIFAVIIGLKFILDTETETIERELKLLAEPRMVEGDGQQFEDYDNSLDILLDEDGNQYIEVLKLDASTSLVAVEGGGYNILEHGQLNINETIVLDDNGDSIEMKLADNFVTPYLYNDPITSFTLDEHSIEIRDNCYYADGIPVMIPENATTTQSSSETEKTAQVNTSEKTVSSSALSQQVQSNVNTAQTTRTNATVSHSITNRVTTTTRRATVKTTKKTTVATTKKVKKTTTTKKITTKKKTTTTTEAAYTSSNADLNEVVRLVNVERKKVGLPALKMKLVLNKMAHVRAKESAKFFSHTRPDGTSAETIMADYSVSYTMFGENLASGAPTPAEVVQQWMNSPPHKAAILNEKFKYIGVGYYYLKNDPYNSNYYWSQIFYTP